MTQTPRKTSTPHRTTRDTSINTAIAMNSVRRSARLAHLHQEEEKENAASQTPMKEKLFGLFSPQKSNDIYYSEDTVDEVDNVQVFREDSTVDSLLDSSLVQALRPFIAFIGAFIYLVFERFSFFNVA